MRKIEMKMTFKCEHYEYGLYGDQSKEPNQVITYETKNLDRDEILEDFKHFLQACGFQINGTIEVVPDEEEFILTNTKEDELDVLAR